MAIKKKTMKAKFKIIAILLIISAIYMSFNFAEPIKIQLIDAKTNTPIANKEIETYYVECVYDAPANLELIEKLKTDNNGNFELQLSRGILNGKRVGIKCGDEYDTPSFNILNNEIWFFRYRNGFSQALSKTRYNLTTKTETNFVYFKDTVDSKFERIKVIAYNHPNKYWNELDEKLNSRKEEFQNQQADFWKYLWSEFEKAVDGETNPPLNAGIWFKHHISSHKKISLDLTTAYQETKKIEASNKLYYYLYSLCMIINGQEGKIKESERGIIEWIDLEVKNLYDNHPKLDMNKRNDDLPRDVLASAYKSMKNNLKE